MRVHAENFQISPEALAPGTQVGPWRVVERLGAGGFGATYRVEDTTHPGDFYALKLALRLTDAWAEREVCLLMEKAAHPNVVRLHGSGRWPHPATGYLYFVMDWIPGLPLHTWAEVHNPSFRLLVEKVGVVALALDELHRRSVLHRDLKPEHVRIREPDGTPVLIDFGVGHYAGAATITTSGLPPGTRNLRSPEALRFMDRHSWRAAARYRFQPTDDLYALGATLYRVVTGHDAFPAHQPADRLHADILGRVPEAPAAVNPRVPRALSEVIARLLSKHPEERYATGAQLHGALVAALAFSKPEEVEASVFEWEDAAARRIRRPEWPTRPVTPPPSRRTIFVAGPRSLLARWRGERVPAEPLAEERREASRHRWPPAALAGALGAVALLGLAAGSLRTQGAGTNPTRAVVEEEATPEVQKVAPLLHSPDAGQAATPLRAEPTPAATAPQAVLPEELIPVKKLEVDTPPRKEKGPPRKDGGSLKKTLGTGAACIGLACSSPQVVPSPTQGPTEVRSPLPPEECPPGAIEAMNEHSLKGYENPAAIIRKDESRAVPVKNGQPFQLHIQGTWNRLYGVPEMYGRFSLGKGRVFGRVIQARNKEGIAFPVCIELYDAFDRKRGIAFDEETQPGDVRIHWNVDIQKVKRFE